MPTVRDTATVRVSDPVDGMVTRAGSKRARPAPVDHVKVDPRVLATAKRIRRPGECLVIVNESEVRLVPAQTVKHDPNRSRSPR